MTQSLTRRIAAIERRMADRAPDPAAACPVAWSARFEAHRPENAAIMAAARGYPTTCRGEHVGDVAVSLCLEAGFDAWDGKNITMRPNPTPEEMEALGVLERLLGVTREYVRDTGDRFPRAIYRLG